MIEKSPKNKKLDECSSREKINDTLNEKPSFEVINKKKNRLETPACSRALKDTLNNKRRSFLEENKSEILMTKDIISSSKLMRNNKKLYEEEEEYKNKSSCYEEYGDSSDFFQQKNKNYEEIIKKDNFFENKEKNRISYYESRSHGQINEKNECDFLEDFSHIMSENGDFPFYHQEKGNQRSNHEIDSFLELMPSEVSEIEVDCDEDKEESQAWLLSFD